MRQILLNSEGAVIARMPRPSLETGSVLVRAHFSLISVGTEVASLRPSVPSDPDSGILDKIQTYNSLASLYLGKAIRNPGLAARRVQSIAMNRVRRGLPNKTVQPRSSVNIGEVIWNIIGQGKLKVDGSSLHLITDKSQFGYQCVSQDFSIPKGHSPCLEISGEVEEGLMCVGLLSGKHGKWIDSFTLGQGSFDERFVYEAGGAEDATLVIANAGTGSSSSIRIAGVNVLMIPPDQEGLPHSEMNQQGWNVGYSLAGEVVAVGEGVSDLAIGDMVACAGAGSANHAEYVAVKRNLVCPIPKGCDPRWAATTTVGTIALQGVRRANIELGEKVGVIGLGLIGQMTVQILRAAGCRVIGLDIDATRVERALAQGMDGGTDDPDEFKRLVIDATCGHGLDKTLITASSKSSRVVNLSMEITRMKGCVVLVGDVKMDIERSAFYRKEINLLMSTSYGPGRYDREYEVNGIDYPYSYVRWTENRNMESFMELIATGRIDMEPLIDRVVSLEKVPETYKELVKGDKNLPLGVLIKYQDQTAVGESAISLRGHRKPKEGMVNFVLVGAGAFGTSMLVPQLQKRKDVFFLKGVVSSNATRGGNYARSQGIELLASDIKGVLDNSDVHLAVIATRHDKHAKQVAAAILAEKHVFVEKPLALSWDELDTVDTAYKEHEKPPLVMIGFNRRFAPALQLLKQIIEGRRSPLVINYRLNAGYIPADSWIQAAEGGGRNVGEACHMYDVFRFLAGAPVTSIQAQAINPQGTAYLRNDNFCATMGYEDGSIGNLVYTALGPKQGMSKEYIEVFVDGNAYIVDDFKSLVRAGDSAELWSGDVDKGHFEELSRFGESIVGDGEAPIPFDEIIETSAVALHVEDLLYGRG